MHPNRAGVKKYYFEVVKDSKEYGDVIMKYVQHDSKNKQRRRCLRKGDNRLFLDKTMYDQCQFVKHMQLRHLWKHQGPNALTKADKDQIWNMLRQLWLLAQATLTLPPLVCEKMEKMARERAQSFGLEGGVVSFTAATIQEVAKSAKKS